MIDEYYTWKIFGYHSDDLKPHSTKYVVAVCDGCGLYNSMPMWQYNRNNDLCPSCAHIGKRAKYRERTPEQNTASSKTRLAPKEPLPDGRNAKLSDITDNKASTTYLGCVAETILSYIYDSVQVMPYGNHGFDVICNRDKMIDIKASATGYKGYWAFAISKNKVADFFLCIAFESRDDLHTPIYLWLIPGHIVNHLVGIRIYKTTIDKWNEYELSIDKLLVCCDNMKNDNEEAST